MATTVSGLGLHLVNVSRSFDDTTVINNLTLQIDAGEFLAILGPSGCGKSTLLRIMAGLIPANSGTCTINPPDTKFSTAYVFQDAHLLPWRSVLENTALPLELMGVPAEVRMNEPAPHWLKLVFRTLNPAIRHSSRAA